MTTPVIIAVGALCVTGATLAYAALVLRALVAADEAWEADPGYASDWDTHCDEALAAATDVPDYIPAEWETQQ